MKYKIYAQKLRDAKSYYEKGILAVSIDDLYKLKLDKGICKRIMEYAEDETKVLKSFAIKHPKYNPDKCGHWFPTVEDYNGIVIDLIIEYCIRPRLEIIDEYLKVVDTI